MSNTIVTGATGFLGARVCLRLLNHGYRVRAFGRNSIKGNLLAERGAEFVSVDLGKADQKQLASQLFGFDTVIHCAGLASSGDKFEAYYSSNVEATKRLIEASKAADIKRFVHISTPSIYMDFCDKNFVKETDPLPKKQLSAYSLTKLMAERLVLDAHGKSMESIAIRPQGFIGAGDNVLIPNILKAAVVGLPKFRDQPVLLDLTHIENVVDAILLACEAKKVSMGKVYNISNGEPIELHKTAKEVCQKLGLIYREKRIPAALAWVLAHVGELANKLLPLKQPPQLLLQTYSILSFNRTLNCELANFNLGFEPKLSLAQGLDEFCNSYQI